MRNHSISRIILSVAAATLSALSVMASWPAGARVHCEEDTAAVSRLLGVAASRGGNLGERCVAVAKALEGTPWSPAADNDSLGTLVVNLHGFDRMGFVNTVLAVAQASGKRYADETEFENSLASFSRRKGEDLGFESQLLYGSDWVVDNVYRGNLKDLTEYLGGGGFKAKTLDYVSRHKDEYPALANPETLDKIKMMEMGYRSHRIPHMKKQAAGGSEFMRLLQDGDIIMMLSPAPDYDVYDIGFVEMRGGEPYLIHISYENGKVVADPYPLQRLFKLENQHFYGFRWLRPTE